VNSPDDTTDVSEPRWSRLALRMLFVQPLADLRGMAVVAFSLLFVHSDIFEWIALAAGAFTVAISITRVLTTRYRVTADCLEYRTGLIGRHNRSLPRDRIRVFDQTAVLRYRLSGLTEVRIGAGNHSSDGIHLGGITRREAARLRKLLLTDTAAAATPASHIPLVTASRRWMWYAPFTLSGVTIALTLLYSANHLAYSFGVDASAWSMAESLLRWSTHTNLALVLAAATPVVVLAISALSILGYLVAYWGFTVSRISDGSLRIQRGLLTTRSTTVQEQRIRGVTRNVQLPLRIVRAARAHLIVGGARAHSPLLLPSAPRDRVHDTITAVLGTDPTAVPLRAHPRAALPRRIVRAVVPTLLVSVVLFWLARNGILPSWTWQTALCCLPLAIALGWHRYRTLGHQVTDDYLVSSGGSLLQETAAVLRRGVTDVALHQTLFQRRAGLANLKTYVAAGHGSYAVRDMAHSDATAIIDQVLPAGVLAPFLANSAAQSTPPLHLVHP